MGIYIQSVVLLRGEVNEICTRVSQDSANNSTHALLVKSLSKVEKIQKKLERLGLGSLFMANSLKKRILERKETIESLNDILSVLFKIIKQSSKKNCEKEIKDIRDRVDELNPILYPDTLRKIQKILAQIEEGNALLFRGKKFSKLKLNDLKRIRSQLLILIRKNNKALLERFFIRTIWYLNKKIVLLQQKKDRVLY